MMNRFDIAALINVLGWTLGFALYAMLFAIAVRAVSGKKRGAVRFSGFDKLPLVTAILGLMWNAGTLVTHALPALGIETISGALIVLLEAASLSALGFLPAVVVHSVMTPNARRDERTMRGRWLTVAAYTLSCVAAVMHLGRLVIAGNSLSRIALYISTIGFAVLMLCLFRVTRGEHGARRAVWATALAVFAVSALHLSIGGSEGNHERWYIELVGHHASLPLAFAILYQDYRFAFADVFLKRALNLFALLGLVAVGCAASAWLLALPPVEDGTGFGWRLDARALGVMFVVWAGTIFVYPYLANLTARFVDKVILRRADYAELRAQVAQAAQERESIPQLLDDVCTRLRPALTADSLAWREVDEAFAGQVKSRDAESLSVGITTTEAPRYELIIGELAGGRRLFSDDFEMLEAVATIIARRIDQLRVTHERCEQVQREQEISKLVTEAELRALRAQINPHFLFNALTTIGYLIQTAPPRALETLMRLTDLLRRVLRAGEAWTTLGEELKLVEAYLDIERARFEERLRVRFDVAHQLHELIVPSLVVQPLVENAIKHGITLLRAGGDITIAARVEHDALIINVTDTGAGASQAQLAAGRSAGVGLNNVEQRLRLCCGAAGELHITSTTGEGTSVTLRVPVRRTRTAIVADTNGIAADKVAAGVVTMDTTTITTEQRT
ncbi:MAG: sensor histidine kinase [Pyrinomonadaceae bacterium MAG19_C2-C3]|nr:sensor histidine kinase [Pyrinomonadaceae bacterium MAG19_C2-C3]